MGEVPSGELPKGEPPTGEPPTGEPPTEESPAGELPAPLLVGRQVGDLALAALTLAAVAGAWFHPNVPFGLSLGVVTVGLIARRPWILVIGVAFLSSTLAVRSYAGLANVEHGAFSGIVTLVRDPKPSTYGASADVRAGGRRLLLQVNSADAGALEHALAGERVLVQGEVRPPPPGSGWMVPRHLAGIVKANSVELYDGGSVLARGPNRIRRSIEQGFARWSDKDRALVGGFLLGDDRGHSDEMVADFRDSGLSHLMVVSGQNVAFILVLASPLLMRLEIPSRWAVSLVLLGTFGLVTRFDPSVLRAIAMAVVATSAQLMGRASSTWRNLGLAVSVLILIDPLLVRSVGFVLSVCASASIALFATRIAGSTPGPRWLVDPLSVTIAAQLGVAPLLLSIAGGIPVVSVPANLIAGGAAAVVTTYGLTTGLIGLILGALAGPFGAAASVSGLVSWLQSPSVLAARWVSMVAEVSARVPLGDYQGVHVAILSSLGLLVVLAHQRRWPGGVGRGAIAVMGVLSLVPLWGIVNPPLKAELHSKAVVWMADGSTVVDVQRAKPRPELLSDLRRRGVRRIDVLVVKGRHAQRLSELVEHRWKPSVVVNGDSDEGLWRVGSLLIEAEPGEQVGISRVHQPS
ncbi:MAG: ComEC/Rec2 family competence protein [Acidimicrobiales bacterium]|nr:ComEC/Rec2 family competence protein [Acidimicrobiales bacterium]